MIYSEAAYFDGAHVQHIAAFYEEKRLARRNKQRKLQCEGQALAGQRSTWGMTP